MRLPVGIAAVVPAAETMRHCAPRQPTKRIVFAVVSTVVLALGAAAGRLGGEGHARQRARPPIVWQQPDVALELTPGESDDVLATFTARRRLKKLAVRAAPELAPYVVVDSGRLGKKVKRGEAVTLTLRVSIAPDAVAGERKGSIALIKVGRRGTGKPLADPMSLRVVVQGWEHFDNQRAGYSVDVPPGHTVVTASYSLGGQNIEELTVAQPDQLDAAIRISTATLAAPLTSLDELRVDDPLGTERARIPLVLGAHDALRIDSDGEDGAFVEFIMLAEGRLFTVNGPESRSAVSERIARSLTVTKE